MDSLGDRMKAYEASWDTAISSRFPLIIRVDGKGFHTYTKGMEKPWSDSLISVMDDTAKFLVSSIQEAQFAYVQSDEISILVHGYKTFLSSLPFGGRVQKLCSVSASLASAFFTMSSSRLFDGQTKLAVFDSRVFIVPESDVVNYFVWRQQDAIRNSVQMLARSLYKHKEVDKKNTTELLSMCVAKGKDWEDLAPHYKRGRCVLRQETPCYDKNTGELLVTRMKWGIDRQIPVFSSDREYIGAHLACQT